MMPGSGFRCGAACRLALVACAVVLCAAGPAPAGMLPAQRGDGVADLYVGGRDLILQPDGAAVNGFILTSQATLLTGEAYVFGAGVFVTDSDAMLADQFGYVLAGPHDLGRVLSVEAPLAELAEDLTLSYTLAGQAGVYYATIAAAQVGDCDVDGVVGPADLLRMEQTFGLAAGAVWLDADFTGEGAVDYLDYIALKRHFGLGEPPPGVPEPATLALLAAAAGAAAARRPRPRAGGRKRGLDKSR